MLAGIPSIIYGIWGLFVFAPFLQQTLQPFLIDSFGDVPILSSLFAGPPYGIGMLTAGLILAIMVLPFITSISRDVFDAVPPVLKEAAYGVGCTTWEVFRNVVVPFTRIGVIGGVMLGLGRALGETMAVTFVIGNAHRISSSILAPGTTISATIANEFTEAVGDHLHVLADRARPHPLRHHLRGAGDRPLPSHAARTEGRGSEPWTKLATHDAAAATALRLGLVAVRHADRSRLAGLILGVLLWEGLSGLSLSVFTEMTPPPGSAGGLLNPIMGSLIMTGLGVLIGTPDRRPGRHLHGRVWPL